MNEKIVPAKIIHGCAKTWHTLPADLRPATPPRVVRCYRVRQTYGLPARIACHHWEARPVSRRTPLGVQGLVEWGGHGGMRTPLGVRGEKY